MTSPWLVSEPRLDVVEAAAASAAAADSINRVAADEAKTAAMNLPPECHSTTRVSDIAAAAADLGPLASARRLALADWRCGLIQCRPVFVLTDEGEAFAEASVLFAGPAQMSEMYFLRPWYVFLRYFMSFFDRN